MKFQKYKVDPPYTVAVSLDNITTINITHQSQEGKNEEARGLSERLRMLSCQIAV